MSRVEQPQRRSAPDDPPLLAAIGDELKRKRLENVCSVAADGSELLLPYQVKGRPKTPVQNRQLSLSPLPLRSNGNPFAASTSIFLLNRRRRSRSEGDRRPHSGFGSE